MFDFIRTHQRLMQLILLILILPSFALIGVSGYTTYVSGDHELAQVGNSAVTQQEFDQARRNQLERLQARAGAAFDPGMLDTPEAREALLQSLIQRRVLINEATENRFSVSDNLLRQAIAAIPELQEDGHFSPERYNAVLASMGLSSRDFEQSQRSELSLQRVIGPVGASAAVPATVLDRVLQALTEARTVRTRTFATADYSKDIKVSDADIQAWYDANQAALKVPESVTAQYLLLDEQAAMQNLPEITAEQMQQYYDQNKARYVTPARVQVSHILIQPGQGVSPDQARAKAEDLAKQAAADPAKFASLAAEYSQDAGTAKQGGALGWISRGAWPAEMEDAVFALEKGQVSGVVQSDQGFHIFLASDVQREQGESFEQAKSKVQAEIRRQLAADKFADMATRLTGLVYDDPASLEPAAQALGLTLRTAGGIAADRLLPANQSPEPAASASPDAAVLDDPRVRRAVFSPQVYNEKHNSGVIEISSGVMLVVRAKDVIAEHVLPLEQASPGIRERLTAERAAAAARAAGESVLAQLQKSDGSAQPEGFGAEQSVSRANPQGLDKATLDAAFKPAAAALPAYQGVSGPQGYTIVRVQGVKSGEPEPALKSMLALQLEQAQGMAEQQAALQAMRDAAQVKISEHGKEVVAEGAGNGEG